MNKSLLACSPIKISRQNTTAKDLVTANKVKGCFCHFSLSVINCTFLTVDPGGSLRTSSCDNHYGAQCNFSCAIGYRLNGSSTVTCVAPGNQHPGVWNSSIPTCEGKLENVTIFKLKLKWSAANSPDTIILIPPCCLTS